MRVSDKESFGFIPSDNELNINLTIGTKPCNCYNNLTGKITFQQLPPLAILSQKQQGADSSYSKAKLQQKIDTEVSSQDISTGC